MIRRALVSAFLVASALASAACIPPQMPVEKLTDNAYEVVMAARFGRMDIVTAMVRPDLRAQYAEAHSEWGGRSRILDIEYSGMRLIQSDKAIVAMTVSWQRLDESMLRTTALAQTWERGEGGWLIVDEAFAGGDKGLLLAPEPKPTKRDGAPTDAQNAVAQASSYAEAGTPTLP